MASLLEVGTGFHPELTGRENIYMNGVIAGLRDDEADAEVFVRQWPAGPQDQDPFHYGAAQTVLAYAHKCN